MLDREKLCDWDKFSLKEVYQILVGSKCFERNYYKKMTGFHNKNKTRLSFILLSYITIAK